MSTLELFKNDVVGEYWYYTGAHESTIWYCVRTYQDENGVLWYEFSSPQREKNKKVRVDIFDKYRGKYWQKRDGPDDIHPKYPSPSPKPCNIL
jgi:hypothetical protein